MVTPTITCYLEIIALYPDELRGRNVYRHDIKITAFTLSVQNRKGFIAYFLKGLVSVTYFRKTHLFPSTATRAKIFN